MTVEAISEAPQPKGQGEARKAEDLSAPELFSNQELGRLDFHYRVLEQVVDERHPLLERVKFLAITGSNLL